jgi:hypothetical protein
MAAGKKEFGSDDERVGDLGNQCAPFKNAFLYRWAFLDVNLINVIPMVQRNAAPITSTDLGFTSQRALPETGLMDYLEASCKDKTRIYSPTPLLPMISALRPFYNTNTSSTLVCRSIELLDQVEYHPDNAGKPRAIRQSQSTVNSLRRRNRGFQGMFRP